MNKLKMNLQRHAGENIEEQAIANIARVDIVTEEATPVTYSLTEVATEASVEATISEGIDEELRVKDSIKAQNKTKDLVKGYDITLTSATMVPEILALIDGGTWNEVEEEYKGAPIGVPFDRTKFTIHIFAEKKGTDGDTEGYIQFTYENCEGKPLGFTQTEGEFYSPELSITSRPKLGASPSSFKILTELPV